LPEKAATTAKARRALPESLIFLSDRLSGCGASVSPSCRFLLIARIAALAFFRVTRCQPSDSRIGTQLTETGDA
jgi:hypothetical protein